MSQFGPNAARIPTEAVREGGRVERLKPTEEHFRGKPGYERYHIKNGRKVPGEGPDGRYKWKYNFRPNEGGKLTKEAQMVGAMMSPYMKADMERRGGLGAWAGKVRGRRKDALTDGDSPPCRTFCPNCELLTVWCACVEAA